MGTNAAHLSTGSTGERVLPMVPSDHGLLKE